MIIKFVLYIYIYIFYIDNPRKSVYMTGQRHPVLKNRLSHVNFETCPTGGGVINNDRSSSPRDRGFLSLPVVVCSCGRYIISLILEGLKSQLILIFCAFGHQINCIF